MNKKYLYYTLFTLSLIVALFSYSSISKVYEKRSELDIFNQKIASLEEENSKLAADLEYKKTDEFVINEARLKLNYGFKNETTYVIPKDIDTSGEKKENSLVPAEKSDTNYTNSSYVNRVSSPESGLSVYQLWIEAFF